MIQDFKDEFIELYGENNFIIIEKLINSACEASIRYKDYINELDYYDVVKYLWNELDYKTHKKAH